MSWQRVQQPAAQRLALMQERARKKMQARRTILKLPLGLG
jgi:hypothetical protein